MKKISIAILIMATAAGSAHAFKLNPMNRYIVAPQGTAADHFSEPVHERITRLARERFVKRCVEETPNDAVCKLNSSPDAVIQDSLIRGVWWNDDPNQSLYRISALTWVGHMWDAKRRANNSAYTIDSRYKMHYRSHYGDMQFLHSMASADGEKAVDTKQKILMWAEFAYRMATNELKPATHFKAVKIENLNRYFARQADWQLSYIMQPKYHLEDTPNDFADHALGSLLHMVEDSYSAAHIERDYAATKACPTGHIKRFLAYTHQDSAKHGAADTWAAYKSSGQAEMPVDVSAQLIWFARRKADWAKEVAPYLDKVVYCTEEATEVADSGIYH
ncbi:MULTISPECIES: hypothetical protein [Pseudomonas]|uniref:Alginate lyase n=1 Tax=Pseudomonas baetica TaxID=674054 RepID=A0ABX4PXX9_9PSED|nr:MULTISPECIES: hypothetical protein [Pseudomonas]MDR9863363.1 hypothetical protein [Pseudomonas baetica]PKA68638.1 hypothetical protein ATI02_1423 [Pseudomonas baetica]PTC17518.1 hypothetical protein C0J26_15590 [Pseudomonas baetica]